MNQFFFYLKEGFNDLWKNKGRSFLTSLGIIIGVYSVIMLLSLGEGLKIYIEQQFESLGTNLVYVLPGDITSESSHLGGSEYTYSDFLRLQNGLSGATVVPVAMKSVIAVSKFEEKQTSMIGSTQDIFYVRNLTLESGRYFSKSEELSGRKVVVIGPTIAEDLFKNQNPLQQKVKLQDLTFTVIGVLEAKGGGGGFGGPDFDSFLYTPHKTLSLISGEKTFMAMYVEAVNPDAIDLLKKKIERLMLKKYDASEFEVSTQNELLGTISGIFNIINSVLVGIGAISLLVGGVGITNIMYVTVTERTKEIGIRRAVGAQEKNILLQFLTISVLLTSIGGLFGFLLAYITNLFIYQYFPVTITVEAVGLAFFVSFTIGVIFGVFPARKAAKLSPVEAIRYE